MREESRQCSIKAPAQDVWDYLSDYRNVVRLASPNGKAKLVTGQPGVVGATYKAGVEWEGLESRFRTTLTEADPPHYLVWAGRASGVKCAMRFDLQATGRESTNVRATVFLAMGEGTTPLEPFGWALLDRMLGRLMRRLHESKLEEFSA